MSDWYGDESGPMVRLYALTRGRARPSADFLDIIALVSARTRPEHDITLSPEQAVILQLCQAHTLSVAEIAARANLPLNVTRVLLADLLNGGHIEVTRPAPAATGPTDRILREVLNGLRAL